MKRAPKSPVTAPSCSTPIGSDGGRVTRVFLRCCEHTAESVGGMDWHRRDGHNRAARHTCMLVKCRRCRRFRPAVVRRRRVEAPWAVRAPASDVQANGSSQAVRSTSRCESVRGSCTYSHVPAVAEDEVGAKLPPVGLQPWSVRFRRAASQHQPAPSRRAVELRRPESSFRLLPNGNKDGLGVEQPLC